MAKIKFKARHETREGVVTWMELEGTVVVIPDYEEYTFMFHRRPELKGWFISELSTGLCVYPVHEYCKSKAQAIDMARQYLDMYTSAGVLVANGFKMYLDRENNGEPVNEVKKKTKQRRLI
jgi:hypothetical protein